MSFINDVMVLILEAFSINTGCSRNTPPAYTSHTMVRQLYEDTKMSYHYVGVFLPHPVLFKNIQLSNLRNNAVYTLPLNKKVILDLSCYYKIENILFQFKANIIQTLSYLKIKQTFYKMGQLVMPF